MGKYMKKAKTSGEVALMDSYLGVRTRAKTLALQNSGGGGSYLQLRSRRLEKQTLICDSKRQKQTPKESPVSNPKNPNLVADEGTRLETEEKKRDDVDEGIEASFGENVVEFEGRERWFDGIELNICSFQLTAPAAPWFSEEQKKRAAVAKHPPQIRGENLKAFAYKQHTNPC